MSLIGRVRQREGFVSGLTARARGYAEAAVGTLIRSFPRRGRSAEEPHPFQPANDGEKTKVDRYWSRHTVRAPGFGSRRSSERYLEWRFAEYPLFREFTGLWGDHSDEVVLDYGCGPGNDLTGLALYTRARRLIGIDVSQQALSLAGQRLALHGVTRDRVQLIHIADSGPGLPLDAASVDYTQSLGVIHHTSDPGAVLREIHRVLKPGGRACVMVYNRESVWFHLYTAYERMICARAFAGLGVEEAFARNTDGEDCPIARCYRAEEFVELCQAAGFEAEFVGGYLSRQELRSLKASWAMGLADDRLGGEHRQFLRALSFDASGLPMLGGYHAGIGGVYRLKKPEGDAAIVSEPQAS